MDFVAVYVDEFSEAYGPFDSKDAAILFAVQKEKDRFPENAHTWDRSPKGETNAGHRMDFDYTDDLMDCGWVILELKPGDESWLDGPTEF